MTTPFRRTRLAAALAGVTLALGAGAALGAGFALQENSGSGLGNGFAGGAAVAEDAGTVWANPAGMSRIPTMQAVQALHLILPTFELNNANSLPAAQQTLGNTGGNAGTTNWVPNLYVVMPINRQWAFGLGLNAPFGLVSDYNDSWLGRFQGVKSDVKTMNINPALSWKISDSFSLGAGANYQQVKATFTNQANYSAALLGAAALAGIAPGSQTYNAIAAATPRLESSVNLTGDDWAWGWNAGLLWEIDKKNRIGVHYRSNIKYDVSGNVEFTNPALPPMPSTIAPTVGLLAATVNARLLYNSGVASSIKLPSITNVSWFGAVSDRWDLMADLQYTTWDSLPELKFNRTDGSVLAVTPYNWDNVWRASIGANYHYNDKMLVRAGFVFDQSPLSDEFRTVRLPDDDRLWVTLGTQYKWDRHWTFDIGAAYGWASSNPPINQNQGSTAQYGLVNGDYKVNFTIVSGQITYSF